VGGGVGRATEAKTKGEGNEPTEWLPLSLPTHF
jgi:hypothetical protein